LRRHGWASRECLAVAAAGHDADGAERETPAVLLVDVAVEQLPRIEQGGGVDV